MAEGPITKAGIHPITGTTGTVVKDGTKGAGKSATPTESQISGEGAKETAEGGKHMQNGKQEKTMAQVMYPVQRGLKGKVEE